MPAGCPVRHHGVTKALGCRHAAHAAFGFLFHPPLPRLDFPDELLSLLGSPAALMHDQSADSPEATVPAGYTFFAQFLDHDVTLDTDSTLNKPGQNPADVRNLRTPSLDLDCVYALGPEATPHVYDRTREGFLATGAREGRPRDLARSATGAALIGDPRNDENIFVSQMHLLWINFHNALMLHNLGSGRDMSERFEEVQSLVRHHYQHLVLYDFLARICHPATYDAALEKIEAAAAERLDNLRKNRPAPQPDTIPLHIRHADASGVAPMPVEFSVAAFRFGHTTVRDRYPANANQLDIELFDERFGTLGFSALPPELEVDWRFLLEVDPAIDPVNMKAFDHLFADELIALPDPVVGRASPDERSLAFRNLARGRSLGLPSGEDVADALRSRSAYPSVRRLRPEDLYDPRDFPSRESLARRARDASANRTPLFFYLMREAAIEARRATLGPAASAILLEVFGRMLVGCNTSFFFRTERRPDGSREYVGDFKPLPYVAGENDKQTRPDRPSTRKIKKIFARRLRRRFEHLGADPPTRDPSPLDLADIVRFVNDARDRLGDAL